MLTFCEGSSHEGDFGGLNGKFLMCDGMNGQLKCDGVNAYQV